jgi:hypothetical protein
MKLLHCQTVNTIFLRVFLLLIVVVNHLNGHVSVDIKIKEQWVTFDDRQFRINKQVFQSKAEAIEKARGSTFVHKPLMFVYLKSDGQNNSDMSHCYNIF